MVRRGHADVDAANQTVELDVIPLPAVDILNGDIPLLRRWPVNKTKGVQEGNHARHSTRGERIIVSLSRYAIDHLGKLRSAALPDVASRALQEREALWTRIAGGLHQCQIARRENIELARLTIGIADELPVEAPVLSRPRVSSRPAR